MATLFTYQDIYFVHNNGNGTYTITLDDGGSGAASNYNTAAEDITTNDGSFHIGDLINDNSINGELSYIGHTQNGFVLAYGDGTSFLYSNDTYLANGTETFTLQTDDFPVCFLTGTMIVTPEGERPVEDLTIGDLVLTADGETRAVRWMGRQTMVRVFADPQRAWPVTIRAGALGENVPTRDLHVSPDHAMFVDGILAHAGALVNGDSIVPMADVPERFMYHHIELEDHAIILAEGAPAESFVDAVTRRRFDNFAEYEALYGAEEADMIADHDAPRALSARQLPPELRARLAARAYALDYAEKAAA